MNRKYSLFVGLAASLCLFSTLPATASTTINDGAPTDGWNPLGGDNYGVVFTAPTQDSVLQDYTLYARAIPFQTGFQVRTDIIAWNGNTGVGPLLYQSGVFTVPANNSVDFTTGYTSLTSNTGGLTLVAGQQYIAIASTASDLPSANVGAFGVSSVSVNSPNNFGVYFQGNPGNSTSNFSQPNTWGQLPSTPAFLAHFGGSAVPEPSGAGALAAGAAILGLFAIPARRRLNRRAR